MRLNQYPNNKPVFTTTFVMKENKEIVCISLDDDNDLQMFSNEGADQNNVILVSLKNILMKDTS